MSRRIIARAIVALAVPVLAVPALTTPAHAAKAPKVPTIEKVTAIYPHLAGGQSQVTTSDVKGITKKCEPGKAIKGASATSAYYTGADFTSTAAAPTLTVSAMSFKNTAAAVQYLRGSNKNVKCPSVDVMTGEKAKAKVKKLPFKAGDENWGYTVTVTFSGRTAVTQTLLARDGKNIVLVGASAADGGTPSAKPAIKLMKLALKTV